MSKKKVRNPLIKRIPKELIGDWKKYLVVFLFLVLTIGFVSGMYVANESMLKSAADGVKEYKQEDGHFELKKQADDALLSAIETGEKADVKQYYLDEAKKKLDKKFPKKFKSTFDEKFKSKFDAQFSAQVKQTLVAQGMDEQTVAAMLPAAVKQAKADGTYKNAYDKAYSSAYTDAYDKAYDEAWKKAQDKIEDKYADAEEKYELNDPDFKATKTTVYENFFRNEEEDYNNDGKKDGTIRVFPQTEDINLACLLKGSFPQTKDEIAIDRMHADNVGVTVGDTITISGETYKIVGLLAYVNYSTLHEKTTDLMFDALKFDVAMVTPEGFDRLHKSVHYTYAWKYENEPEDDAQEKIQSDNFMSALLTQVVVADNELEDYTPKYGNPAINFATDDMGSDKAMGGVLLDILIVIIAFIFAVTISNTIAKEASAIGTLRASGYTKGELIRHYLSMPVIVTLLAAIVGNILGYTVFKNVVVSMYYNSYSLPTYHTLWNAEAFIDTTVIPVILMFLVNFLVLSSKLKISPLQFLRRELTKKPRKKAFRLNTKIPFMHRFRLRVVFQNISNYSTLFIGIFFAAVIVIFSLMFGPLLDDYSTMVGKSVIAKYQYALKAPVTTKVKDAEKYCVESLKTLPGKYMEDEITIYGVQKNSNYIKADIPAGEVLVSNGYWEKFGVKKGDKITLKDPYSKKKYTFKVAGYYTYDAVLAVFMNNDDFCDTFDKEKDYYSGYFSKKKLKDIPKEYVASVITVKDLRKVSTQLKVSMENYMELLQYFGVIMFILLMYLLSKQIIEKNSNSIALTKILGYTNGEIGGLYIITTFIVVVLSLLLTIPLVDRIMKWMFTGYLYTQMTGYIPYIISNSCYVKMLIMGIFSYLVVCLIQIIKIQKIPKSDALKNLE